MRTERPPRPGESGAMLSRVAERAGDLAQCRAHRVPRSQGVQSGVLRKFGAARNWKSQRERPGVPKTFRLRAAANAYFSRVQTSIGRPLPQNENPAAQEAAGFAFSGIRDGHYRSWTNRSSSSLDMASTLALSVSSSVEYWARRGRRSTALSEPRPDRTCFREKCWLAADPSHSRDTQGDGGYRSSSELDPLNIGKFFQVPASEK